MGGRKKKEAKFNISNLVVPVQTIQTAARRDGHRQPNADPPHHRPQPATQHRRPGRRGRGVLREHQDGGDGARQGVHGHLQPAPLHQLPDRDPRLQPPQRSIPLQHGGVRQRPHHAWRWVCFLWSCAVEAFPLFKIHVWMKNLCVFTVYI